jgi:hypothetical protein
MLLHESIERALLVVVAELHPFDIVRCCAFALGHFHHLVLGHEQKLGIRIDELLDEPRTCDPIYLYTLACDPLHR